MAQELYAELNDADLNGFSPLNRRNDAALASAAALWADLLEGKVPSYLLQEALAPRTPAIVRALDANYPHLIHVRETMTTSDFPFLTGGVIDRMMLGRFRAYPAGWRQFVRVTTLRDFRTISGAIATGLDDAWDMIPEQSEITYGALGEATGGYTPAKYAKGAKISFEALMNDDLGLFEQIPDLLGIGGARTLNRFVSDLYVGPVGPDAALYNAGNGNIITGNPDLDASALAAGLGQLRTQLINGEPIIVEEAVLVVPPALETVARSILNATELTFPPTAATDAIVRTGNFLSGGLSLVVDPYISVIATANGTTSWFLFANPNTGIPALSVGFVRGYAEPQLFQKLANTVRIGGGVDQMAGDFLTMSQEYKGVMAFGGGIMSSIGTVASNGTNVI